MSQAPLPANHSRPWTEEALQDAVRRHSQGETWAHVAETLGRTERAILQILRKRGIRTRDLWTREAEQQAMAWHQEGMPIEAIAERLERSRSSVDTKIKRLRQALRTRPRASGMPGWCLFLDRS